MPITYDIDRSQDLTTFTLSDEVTFEDMMAVLALYGKEGPTIYELYDARTLAGKRLAFEEMNKLAGYLARFSEKRPSGSKTAIVVAKDVDFGLSRMIQILTETTTIYDIQGFRDMDEARQWLAAEK